MKAERNARENHGAEWKEVPLKEEEQEQEEEKEKKKKRQQQENQWKHARLPRTRSLNSCV